MNLVVYLEVFYNALIVKKGYTEVLLGLRNTVIIAVLGLVIGVIIGTLIAVVKIIPNDTRLFKVLKRFADIYVTILRGTPIVVQLLLVYYVFLPMVGLARIDSLIVGVLAFGLNSSAYVSEIMRAGILSVDSGQAEAGRSLGFTYWQTMRLIIIPQAVKNIIPTLGNEFISLIKETSIVSFISITDLTRAFQTIGASNYEYIIPYCALALIYLVLVLIITFAIRMLERRLRQSDRG